MKRSRFLPIAIASALLAVAAVPAAASFGSNFVGIWEGTDVDGSNMKVWITPDLWSGGRLLHVRETDDATLGWCGGPAKMESLGVLQDENTLAVSVTWWCLGPIENILAFMPGDFTYDPSTGNLTDSWGVVYHRYR